MDNRDNIGLEIKKIMEEETKDIVLSQAALNNILNHRKKTLKEKINEFLNKEIEISLAPVLIGFAALFAVTLIPRSAFKLQNEKIIDIGGSQVIVRESCEVSLK